MNTIRLVLLAMSLALVTGCGKPADSTPSNPDARTAAAFDSGRPYCGEHDLYEDECGICHPERASALAPGEGLKIRFASAESCEQAGIASAPPEVRPMRDGVECYATIEFNGNLLAEIVAPVAGVLREVEADLGDRVARGRVLAALGSAEFAEAAANARLAEQTLARERTLRASGVSSEKELQEAEAAYLAAARRLEALGLDELSSDGALLAVRAPFAGEIVARSAVRGARVEAGKPLFTLADRSTMWAEIHIPEKHLARVRLGQEVEITLEAVPERVFTGALVWIAAEVDDRTRMARARAEIADPDGLLRARMFARARVLAGGADPVVAVPREAVQWIDGRPFVFVKSEEDLLEARSVRLGAAEDGLVAVAEGLGAEEPVVVQGAFLAKSQLLLSRLGAGCVED